MSDGYTKGPWLALDYTDTDEPAWHVVPHDYHGTIATLDPEQSANARLIAAAPTMRDFIQKRADQGDNEAIEILEAINANS